MKKRGYKGLLIEAAAYMTIWCGLATVFGLLHEGLFQQKLTKENVLPVLALSALSHSLASILVNAGYRKWG